MQLTTQQKISFGVLGLAVVAFVVDRCFFSPSTADAQPGPIPQAIAPSKPKAAAISAAARPEDELATLASVSLRLQAAVDAQNLDPGHVKDAFHPASNWLAPAPAKVDAGPDMQDLVNRFRQKHKLLAVLKSSRGAMALVDGKTLRRGQVIDGFKLIEIQDRSVVFDCGTATVELSVSQGKGTDGSSDNLEIRPSGARVDP